MSAQEELTIPDIVARTLKQIEEAKHDKEKDKVMDTLKKTGRHVDYNAGVTEWVKGGKRGILEMFHI